MIYTWEESDIVGGQWVESKDDLRERFCISYQRAKDSDGRGFTEYGVTHISTDGLFLPLGSKADVAKFLTKGNWYPIRKEVSDA